MPDASSAFEVAARIPRLRKLLLRWFRKNARTLPWRNPPGAADKFHSGKTVLRRSPYAAWIAEIMLQQTQVSTVIPYFTKWMRRFPTLTALARASEVEVLQHWAGLGYYSRARNLQLASRALVAEKRYPETMEGWLALPGIGPYTAGAIASLAFDQPEPIVDGNVIRVLSRLFGLEFLPGDGARQKEVYWNFARLWADGKTPGNANESLMELGALICTPSSPRCEECPLSSGCEAFAKGLQESFPPIKKRQPIQSIAGMAVVGRNHGKVLMVVRAKGSFLAGHEMFPIFLGSEVNAGFQEFQKTLGLKHIGSRKKVVEIKHSIMNHRYVLRVLDLELEPGKHVGKSLESFSEIKWISEKKMEEGLTSSLARKIWRAAQAAARL